MSEQQPSPFSPGAIAVTLSELPSRLYDSDVVIAKLQAQAKELKESLELAETNAALDAPDGDGKDATARENKRKLLAKKTVANDPEVKRLAAMVRSAEIDLDVEKANNSRISREFAGMCHIADLKSAQMTLAARGTK